MSLVTRVTCAAGVALLARLAGVMVKVGYTLLLAESLRAVL